MTLYSDSEKVRDTEYGTAAHFAHGCLRGLSDNMHTTQFTTWPFNEIRDMLRGSLSYHSIPDHLHMSFSAVFTSGFRAKNHLSVRCEQSLRLIMMH